MLHARDEDATTVIVTGNETKTGRLEHCCARKPWEAVDHERRETASEKHVAGLEGSTATYSRRPGCDRQRHGRMYAPPHDSSWSCMNITTGICP